MNSKISITLSSHNVEKVVNLLNNIPEEIRKLTNGIESILLVTRKEENSWSVVEIMAHLHACATIWGDTIQEMLTHSFPVIEYHHPGEWQYLSEFSKMSFAQSLDIFIQNRRKLKSQLTNLKLEDWGRIGFIKGKKHTIYSQARRLALHEFSHLEQISSSIILI